MIRAQGLSKVYPGSPPAVDGVDFEVARGETLVLLGASGSGKTTTLKMLNRLVEPTSGRVEIDGRDTRELDPDLLRRTIGYVFQGIGLFPHWSVARNVGAVPELLGWPAARISARVDELLELVELPPGEFRERRPHELSGGQAQRVGVARALAAESPVLLMDEPFGALDPVTRDGLQQQIRSLRERLSLSIVLVTHDVTEALLLAHRIAVLDAGRLLSLGSPEELFRSDDERVRHLLETPQRQAERLRALAEGTP